MTESAEEGTEKIHNTQYDLILTDIKLPGISGNEFFDYVRKNVRKLIPVIAMSGTPGYWKILISMLLLPNRFAKILRDL